MDLLEQVADKLAQDALEAVRVTGGDEDIITQVMKSVAHPRPHWKKPS